MLAMLNEAGVKTFCNTTLVDLVTKEPAQRGEEDRGRGCHERIGRLRRKREGFRRRLGHRRGGVARWRALRQGRRAAAFGCRGREREPAYPGRAALDDGGHRF